MPPLPCLDYIFTYSHHINCCDPLPNQEYPVLVCGGLVLWYMPPLPCLDYHFAYAEHLTYWDHLPDQGQTAGVWSSVALINASSALSRLYLCVCTVLNLWRSFAWPRISCACVWSSSAPISISFLRTRFLSWAEAFALVELQKFGPNLFFGSGGGLDAGGAKAVEVNWTPEPLLRWFVWPIAIAMHQWDQNKSVSGQSYNNWLLYSFCCGSSHKHPRQELFHRLWVYYILHL